MKRFLSSLCIVVLTTVACQRTKTIKDRIVGLWEYDQATVVTNATQSATREFALLSETSYEFQPDGTFVWFMSGRTSEVWRYSLEKVCSTSADVVVKIVSGKETGTERHAVSLAPDDRLEMCGVYWLRKTESLH